LPEELGPLDSLELRVAAPEVGLALRAPGCLVSDELACMGARPSGAQVVIAAPDELRQAGVAPYLFVELPEPGVLGEPVLVQLRKVLRVPRRWAPIFSRAERARTAGARSRGGRQSVAGV
jgi:hypothetical protein